MSVESEQQGSCLCGAVRIFVKTNSKSVAACHCNMCRKWTGGPLLAIEWGNQIRFEGSENISVFNSSEWAERGFCKKCGSHLFYRLKQEGNYIIPVGLLDSESNFTFEQQIFIDQKPSFYSFANKTKNMTEVEVFAQYSEFSDQE
ncbi:MAG: GFA family protein [Cyanobacteriota bacterium]|nr:GFA family protein [Cyanobacteriota bacterium]